MDGKIKIDGLTQLSKALRKVDSEAPKQLRLVGNQAANLLIDKTRPKIPRVSGAAAGSLKAKSTRTSTRVQIGGTRARYYPWLDFGGEGRIAGRPVHRQFIREGRYLYPTLDQERSAITDLLQTGIVAVAQGAGLDVD